MTLRGRVILFNVCLMLMVSISHNALSQTDTIPLSDSVKSKEKESKHSLYSGIGYGSNMVYLGSTISQDQPYGYAALSYGYKDKLFLTISGIHLSNYDQFAAFYAGTISFNHVFNSWFDISASISRYQVIPSLADSLFDNFYYGDLTLGFDWKLLYSKIVAGGLYSGETGFYLQFRNSRYIETPSFFRKKAYFSFDPYVNLIFGSLTKIEATTDTVVTITYHSRGLGRGSGSGSKSTSQTLTNLNYSTSFGILEMDFGLPVAFNLKRVTIEAEPGYILPMFKDPYYQGMKGFVFTISCYLKIF